MSGPLIQLRFASLEITPAGAVTHFPDGTRWGATPHPNEAHYQYLAYRYGHEGDTLAYCRLHELCHHLIAEGFGGHSLTLWALAHGDEATPMVSAAEEALAMTLHRYIMLNEPPLIEGVPWALLKQRYLRLIEEADQPLRAYA